jgi:hypothetical protein
MRTKIALISTLAALGALVPAAAWAQEPAAAAPAAPPAPAEPAPAAAPAPEAPPAAPAAEVAAAAPAAWPGWVRVDSDLFGIQLWGGATAPLGDGLGLAFDAYLTGSLGEFDIGPAITVSTLTLTPMLGAQLDWASHTMAAIVPQFYVVGTLGPMYTELWLQYYNYNTIYKYREKVNPAADNYLYLRFFADYMINDFIAVGPQIELTQDFTAKKLGNMPVGANVFFSKAGAASTFQFFLGYETQKKNFGDNALAGRLSYVHNF